MKIFKIGDKVKIIKINYPWYLKFKRKKENTIGFINKFHESYFAYEVYTNHGIYLVIPENLELIKKYE